MNVQDRVWFIALAGIGLVALGFIFVILQAGKPADEAARAASARTARRLQGRLFAVLLVIFAAGTWLTLRPFPIPPQHVTPAVRQVVKVVGHQWFWQVQPSTIPAGQTVEFQVTSADVNHGFAIYGPDGRIVAQTQSMPGYTNTLRHTFDQPGTYTLQCLEFCGLGHAPMTAEFKVTAADAQPIQ